MKAKRIPTAAWDRYKKIVQDFIDVDSGKQPFTWLRHIDQPLLYGEDSGTLYTPIGLEGLFQYNYIKTWPSNGSSIPGEVDTSNVVLYISKQLLEENGYLDKDGYWDFNWSEDRFILNGKVYKPDGDTQVAQASDTPLLFFIILQREDPEETKKLNGYVVDGTDNVSISKYLSKN